MVKVELQKAALSEKWMNKRVKITKGTYDGCKGTVKYTAQKRVKVQLAGDSASSDLKWKNPESLCLISEEEFRGSYTHAQKNENDNIPNENAPNDNGSNPSVELHNIPESFFQRISSCSTLGESRFAVPMKEFLEEQATGVIENVQFMPGSKRFLVKFAEPANATLFKANPPVIDGVQCTVHDFAGAQVEEDIIAASHSNSHRFPGRSLFDRMQAVENDPSKKRRRGDNNGSNFNRRRIN